MGVNPGDQPLKLQGGTTLADLTDVQSCESFIMPTSSDKTVEISTNITIYDTYSSNADLPAPVPSGADLPASHQSANLPILIGIVWKSG